MGGAPGSAYSGLNPLHGTPANGDVSTVEQELDMLKWALMFALISLVAGVLGFSGIAAGAAGIAKVLFVLFLIAFVVVVAMILLGVSAARK